VEMSPTAAEGADARIDIRIASHLREAGYESGFFDQVVIWHVLEHLTDPKETLEEIHRILRPGGQVVVSVPNFSSIQGRWAGPTWFQLDLPRHLFHFPVRGLRQLMETCGFECVAEHHFSLRQNPFGWVQSALNRSRSLPRNALYTLLHRRSPTATISFGALTRWKLRAAYLLGMPIALVLSIVAALLRSGASVHVVGIARDKSDQT
jgi:SAM-dependent methyltransferase